jgi:dTDP-4-dehydrorhamnose reductase
MNQTGEIYGYKKVYWTGITTLELAKAIDDAIEQNLSSLYHLVPKKKISKYDLLCLIKNTWKRNIKVLEDKNHVNDKSLINQRNDFDHDIPSYEDMLTQLHDWMELWDYSYSK